MADQDLKMLSIAEKENTPISDELKTGPAKFEAKNLTLKLPKMPPPELQHEAKSPEDIRRKIEAQKYRNSGGRADFTAKDL